MPITSNLQLDDPPIHTINIEPLERSGSGSAWRASQKRGRIAGVGASVSGAGAWVKLKGGMDFKAIVLEKSSTYNELRETYGFKAGVSAFWSWLGIGANVNANREKIQKTMNELSQQQETSGHVEVDMYVSGLYPNVEVDASAYVLVLQVESTQGSTTPFNVASAGNPNDNVGAQDQNGNKLPQQNPNNTIDL